MPGKRADESFTPTERLISDSARSPKRPVVVSSTGRTSAWTSGKRICPNSPLNQAWKTYHIPSPKSSETA